MTVSTPTPSSVTVAVRFAAPTVFSNRSAGVCWTSVTVGANVSGTIVIGTVSLLLAMSSSIPDASIYTLIFCSSV